MNLLAAARVNVLPAARVIVLVAAEIEYQVEAQIKMPTANIGVQATTKMRVSKLLIVSDWCVMVY